MTQTAGLAFLKKFRNLMYVMLDRNITEISTQEIGFNAADLFCR